VVPAYLRVLGPADYGTVEVLTTLFTLVTGVLMVGQDSAVAILMPHQRAPGERARLVSSLLTIAAGGGVVGLALFALAGPLLGATLLGAGPGPLLVLGALVVAPSVVQNVAQASLRNLGRARGYLEAALAYGAGVLLVGLPLVVLAGAGPAGAILGVAVGSILAALVASLRQRDLLQLAAWDPARARELLRVGAPLVPASIAGWIVSVSDRVLLARLATLGDVGLYGAAARVATVPNLAIGAFMLGWLPFALRIQHSASSPRLYGLALSLFAAGGAVATLVSIPLGEPVLDLVGGSAYGPAGSVVWLLVGSAFAYGAYVMLNVGVMVAKRTAVISAVTAMAAIVNVAVNLALIPSISYLGAGLATLGAYLASATALFVLGQRIRRLPYEPAYLVVVVLGSFAAGLAAFAVGDGPARWAISFGAAALVALSALPRLPEAIRLARALEADPEA
jgi:O-antigen/teichoic acid export membrane protein